MKKIVVRIRYDNIITDFTALDVQRAMENLFGINTSFDVTPVKDLEKTGKPCKRTNARTTKSFPLSYIAPQEGQTSGQALSKNVSTDGIKILSHSFLVPLQQLIISIPFPKNTTPIGAKVIWCVKRKDSQGYDAGLKFLEMTENIKKDIQDLLRQ